jgi:hypothetical protein
MGWVAHRRASLLVALLTSSVPTTHVLAETADAKPAPLWGYLSAAPPIERNKDLRALAPGSLSLGQAVAAFDRGRTGLVIEIGVSRDAGAAFYAATIGDSSGLRFVRIDFLTGLARSADHPVINRAQLDAQGLRVLAELGSARITLVQAITIAEKFSGKRAIAAGIEQLHGVTQYYIQTATDAQFGSPVVVDPVTGRAASPLK